MDKLTICLSSFPPLFVIHCPLSLRFLLFILNLQELSILNLPPVSSPAISMLSFVTYTSALIISIIRLFYRLKQFQQHWLYPFIFNYRSQSITVFAYLSGSPQLIFHSFLFPYFFILSFFLVVANSIDTHLYNSLKTPLYSCTT